MFLLIQGQYQYQYLGVRLVYVLIWSVLPFDRVGRPHWIIMFNMINSQLSGINRGGLKINRILFLSGLICKHSLFASFQECIHMHTVPFLCRSICTPVHPSLPLHPHQLFTFSGQQTMGHFKRSARHKIDIPSAEQENGYSYSSGPSTHRKGCWPKNRKDRKRGENETGEWVRQKERERKPQRPAVTVRDIWDVRNVNYSPWIGLGVCLKIYFSLGGIFLCPRCEWQEGEREDGWIRG